MDEKGGEVVQITCAEQMLITDGVVEFPTDLLDKDVNRKYDKSH